MNPIQTAILKKLEKINKTNQPRSHALMPDKCVCADKENGIIFAAYGERYIHVITVEILNA